MSEREPEVRSERVTWLILGGTLVASGALAVVLAVVGGAGEQRPAAVAEPADTVAAQAAPMATLYEFEMESCAACDKMRPIVSQVESRCTHGEKIVQRVDIQEPKGEELARKYNIKSVPTFVKVDREGRVLERLVGVQPAAKLAAVVEGVTGKDCAID